MNPEQWLSLKWNGGSTMSDRWLNQSKIIHYNFSLFQIWCKISDFYYKMYYTLNIFMSRFSNILEKKEQINFLSTLLMTHYKIL